MVTRWRLVAIANRGANDHVCVRLESAETETLTVAGRSFLVRLTTLLARHCNMK